MTAKEIKDINREITRLKAKIARIAAEADNTSPKLSDLPSASQTSDKVGNAVVRNRCKRRLRELVRGLARAADYGLQYSSMFALAAATCAARALSSSGIGLPSAPGIWKKRCTMPMVILRAILLSI